MPVSVLDVDINILAKILAIKKEDQTGSCFTVEWDYLFSTFTSVKVLIWCNFYFIIYVSPMASVQAKFYKSPSDLTWTGSGYLPAPCTTCNLSMSSTVALLERATSTKSRYMQTIQCYTFQTPPVYSSDNEYFIYMDRFRRISGYKPKISTIFPIISRESFNCFLVKVCKDIWELAFLTSMYLSFLTNVSIIKNSLNFWDY